MVLTQSIGLGYLTAHLLARRTPTVAAGAISSVSNQKASYLTTSETRNSQSVLHAKERIQNRMFSKKIHGRQNPFDSNELKHRIGGFSIRSMSTAEKEVIEESKKSIEDEQKELAELLKDETW